MVDDVTEFDPLIVLGKIKVSNNNGQMSEVNNLKSEACNTYENSRTATAGKGPNCERGG